MCDLLTKSAEEKIEGYKIVAKKLKGKRYFSIAMGFQYPLDGHIPIVKKQRRISKDFTDILSKTSGVYKDNMIGRTAVFLNFSEVHREFYSLRDSIKEGYKLAIIRSEVSVDVMEGLYRSNSEVCQIAAGRRIHFIEELDRFR